jgi:hypothetical protein
MTTRGIEVLLLLTICAVLSNAQNNIAVRWSVLSMGSFAGGSSNRLVRGIVGQTLTGTAGIENLVLSAGFLADPLLRDPMLSAGEPQTVPSTFELCQNYPNPFNPKTVVSCQLPAASSVRLVVYDLLGREVAVLLDEERPPGAYSITFDASNFASGVYFYRLTAGEYVAIRKMLLLR